jgi:DNA-binding CsgD family transcriptional regulator
MTHPKPTLTKQQQIILCLVAEGYTNQQIADHLDLSVDTVAWHLGNIYDAFGVKNRVSALNVAKRRGLLVEKGEAHAR